MTGGTISGNGASDDGGGVHVMDVNTLSLSGAPIISGNTNSVGSANNVYLGVRGRIDVGPLSEGASIGVTTYLEPEAGSPVAVSSFLASTGDSEYFFSDNPDFSLGLISDELFLIDPSAASYWDPQGTYIWDPYVIEWLSTNGITQADINALGGDSAAMEKMYECYILNCDFRVQDAGATQLSFTDIAVSNDVVSVTVQLTRKAPLGAIHGCLYFYGARDLADGFDSSPIQDASVSFGADDPTFATAPTTGSVTQTATANIINATEKFFKAAIRADLPDNSGVQLWENGPYWAECNVGAMKPEDYGYYFWWGDTVGYARSGGMLTSNFIHPEYYTGVTWVSSTGEPMSSSPFDYESCPTYEKENAELQSAGWIDSTTNLVAAHDAATAHLGAPWRMPTSAEMEALVSHCTTTWITTNGVYGRLVTGTGDYANRSIFLPAAGYGSGSSFYDPGSQGDFWASTPVSDFEYNAFRLYFNSSSFRQSDYSRYLGQPVRPVRDPTD